MLIADIVFEKMFSDGAFESDKTLDEYMMFIDDFSPADADESQVFTAVLIDVIKAYQKQAFRLGFRCCVDAFLESRSITELMISS